MNSITAKLILGSNALELDPFKMLSKEDIMQIENMVIFANGDLQQISASYSNADKKIQNNRPLETSLKNSAYTRMPWVVFSVSWSRRPKLVRMSCSVRYYFITEPRPLLTTYSHARAGFLWADDDYNGRRDKNPPFF